MIEYVAGFAMEGDNVALIVKNKPEWMKGRMNGIGGKVEPGELHIQAMVREFEEETGRATQPKDWFPVAVLSDGKNFVVSFFGSWMDNIEGLESPEEEQVIVVPVDSVHAGNAVPNLTWLIPMAQNISFEGADFFVITEHHLEKNFGQGQD